MPRGAGGHTPCMLESLTDAVSGSPVTYLVVFALVAGDAVIPLLPGESSVVAAAVLASQGDLNVWFIGLAAFAGAFLGDLGMYALGRRVGPGLIERHAQEGSRAERVRWAQDQLDRRGVALIAAAQFIPGGRNVVMIVAGTLGFPFKRFLAAEAIGAATWAAFQTAIGYFGGRLFEDTLVALVVSVAIAIAFGGLIELADRLRRRAAAA
jgi:membrane-associated protein